MNEAHCHYVYEHDSSGQVHQRFIDPATLGTCVRAATSVKPGMLQYCYRAGFCYYFFYFNAVDTLLDSFKVNPLKCYRECFSVALRYRTCHLLLVRQKLPGNVIRLLLFYSQNYSKPLDECHFASHCLLPLRISFAKRFSAFND